MCVALWHCTNKDRRKNIMGEKRAAFDQLITVKVNRRCLCLTWRSGTWDVAGGGSWSWSLTASPPVGGVVPIRQPHTSNQKQRSLFINCSSCVDGKQKFGSSVAFARTLARPLGRKRARERELLFYPRVGGGGLVRG